MSATKSSLYKHIHSRVISEKRKDQKNISFTQYSVYQQCPHQWYLKYGLGNYPFSSTIHTIFGDAIHETLQEYLTILYEKSVKASDEFKMITFFEERLRHHYKEQKKSNGGVHFSTPEELEEFYNDGVAILNYVKKKRKVLFDNRRLELLAIELPLFTQIYEDNDKFVFNAFLDISFIDRETGDVIIIDFKTSTKGWKDYEKKDQTKQNQLLLYKRFLSKQMNIPEDKIEVKFVILKRKIWEDSEFPIPRVQTHIPAQGTAKVNEAFKSLVNFVSECYYEDGTPIVDKAYPKKPGSACRFCPFNNDPSLCNQKA